MRDLTCVLTCVTVLPCPGMAGVQGHRIEKGEFPPPHTGQSHPFNGCGKSGLAAGTAIGGWSGGESGPPGPMIVGVMMILVAAYIGQFSAWLPALSGEHVQ